VVTDLFIGPVTRQPLMAIGVPVVQDGTVRYSLNIRISPRRFQALLDAEARLGGDEFAVLLDGADEAQARATALRLLQPQAEPDDECPAPIDASIGSSRWPDAGRDVASLMAAADAALYAAKRSGKGRLMLAVEPH